MEHIPNQDDLYRFVHERHFRKIPQGSPVKSVAFTNNPKLTGGMSTDWCKYCESAEDTRQRTPDPRIYGVVMLGVGAIRAMHEASGIAKQDVVHDPLQENRAHTEVYGDKDAETRMVFARMCTILLQPLTRQNP